MNTILIGIDPGVNTGFATWDGESLSLDTTTITRAMAKVLVLKEQTDCHIHLFIEDARRRQWFGNAGRERLMGAGSVMRDCRIWEDFCEEQGIQYTLIPPKYNVTKMDAERFATITNYKGRTNEHNRDAAMLVYGRNPKDFTSRPNTDLELLQQIIRNEQ